MRMSSLLRPRNGWIASLEDFERQTSNQVLVAIYRTLDTESSMEDFTQRVAESWRVGQKLHNNGAVLFVFTQPHKMRIEVGYGLEGALPDVLAKQIIDNEIAPSFKAGNYDAGLTSGVNAIMQATRGEYKGTGKTRGGKAKGILRLVDCVLDHSRHRLFIYRASRAARRGTLYGGGAEFLWRLVFSDGRWRGGWAAAVVEEGSVGVGEALVAEAPAEAGKL